MTIKEEKKQVRKLIKELKSQYSYDDFSAKSENVFLQLEQDEDFIKSNIVLAYWSMSDEVQTHSFAEKWSKSKTILLPVIDGDVLKLKYFKGKEKMKTEPKFGILEPTGKEFTDFEKIEYIIVPGVAFDKNNNRLGHGKGYYDKLLPKTPQAKKIGICFDFQLLEEVPVDEFDVKMDLIITET